MEKASSLSIFYWLCAVAKMRNVLAYTGCTKSFSLLYTF